MTDIQDPFLIAFNGAFSSTLRWPQLDQLWDTVRQQSHKKWYIYAIGETPPGSCVDSHHLNTFITEIDQLLRKEHQEDYCGIVYADNREDPSFIKIYDPNNLGVSCGFSDNPPLPGWILSLHTPVDLNARPQAGNRQRWWQKLFQ
ncbi:MAG: hypothetical protein OEY89_12895 [Gammaproteobacteria bacterium]|nr:hypothetical protein [Gammaproteobacteria bacterium]